MFLIILIEINHLPADNAIAIRQKRGQQQPEIHLNEKYVFLEDIRVSRKLMLGFGVLLILSIAVASCGIKTCTTSRNVRKNSAS